MRFEEPLISGISREESDQAIRCLELLLDIRLNLIV